MTVKTRTFPGGVHPPTEKEKTAFIPSEEPPVPPVVYIHLAQHIGSPSRAVVAPGDRVLRGTPIGEATGYVSAVQHATVSGVVKEIIPYPNLFGFPVPTVVIESDGKDEGAPILPELLLDADPEALKKRILEAGVVGKGGASFPTHVKLSPPENKPIDTVILNGAECEPFLTCDHRLMIKHPDRIVIGLEIIARITRAKRKVIGIELNKPDAVESIAKAAKDYGVEVVPLEVKYPQGAEKQLIEALTGREVPVGGLPMDAGVVVQNVSTAESIYNAVVRGVPLTKRIVTVAGGAVKEPKNLRLRIGTPFRYAVECCGGLAAEPAKVICGGPMMGIAVADLDVPVSKGTSGILCFTQDELKVFTHRQCIRCGRCVSACPVHLVPSELSQYAEKRDFSAMEALHVGVCMECGSCAYVCPSRRPMTQWFKWAKAEIAAAKRKKNG